MKGTFGTRFGRSLVIAALVLSAFTVAVSDAGATTASSVLSTCGIVVNPAVHVVSKVSPCVIKVRVGTNVRIKMRSGFRWGYPYSTSKSVVVTTISSGSSGVTSATLHAASVGSATIRATGTVACKPGRACPDLALLWIIKVIVT